MLLFAVVCSYLFDLLWFPVRCRWDMPGGCSLRCCKPQAWYSGRRLSHCTSSRICGRMPDLYIILYNDIVWGWLCSEFSYELDSVKPMISLFAIEVLCNFRVNFLVWNTSSRGSYAISVDEESRELARLLIFLDYRIKLDRHSVVHNATRECSVILKSKTTKRIWKNMKEYERMNWRCLATPLFRFLGCIQERTGSDRSASKTVIGTLKNSDSKMMMWTIEDLRSFKMFQDLPHWCTYSYSTIFNVF